MWKLLDKSEYDYTEAAEVPGGVLVSHATYGINNDVSVALVFLPGVGIAPDGDDKYKLVYAE